VVLSDRRLYAALAAAIVLLAALAGLVAWRAWDSGGGPVVGEEPIVGSALLEPEQHLFGDAVRAQLELVLDRGRVDPDSVEVGGNFAPYRELRPVRRSRTDAGPITRIRYDYLLGCLRAGCLPEGAGRVELAGVAVQFRRHEAGQLDTATIEWPPLRAAGRIAPDQLEQAAIRAELRDLAPPTYRISPQAVEVVALVLAVLLLAAALILGARLLPLDRLAAWLGAHRADRRSPLERALALVRESATAGRPEEGRRALERLAHELRRTRNPELARDATRLAWSSGAPADAGLDPLSTQVERVISEQT
jgi:hypothetical protein